ncbi:MAG: hybrid sensor histidine kinase/response regulator [Hydrococcus sp. Prado102]|jgi:chemotaxis protein histidine kinase CheA/CheY-like chemotaxis protein|nr:hybrid sensor histidine kinase/response regulator [Hydrococcus sp. Prado102]
MTIEPEFQEQIEQYFLTEASDILQTIEQTLLSLLEEKTTEKVHILMRSAHTLKGSAANFELATIKTIAHHLEDVFQALYPAELEIDPDLGMLLLEGYECLRTPLIATLSSLPYDEEVILDKTASVFAQLQHKLGDFFGREAPLPTSEELGFDVVGVIFSDSVPQDLQQLEIAIASQDARQIESSLRYQAQFFVDLGASYGLPGLEAIAMATLTALDRYPDRASSIAQAAFENFQQARDAIMAGDRDRGGDISPQLRDWAELSSPPLESTIPEIVEENLASSLPDLSSQEEVPSLTWSLLEDETSEPTATSEIVEENLVASSLPDLPPQEEILSLSWNFFEDEIEDSTATPEVAENSTPQAEIPSLSWSLFDDQTEETATPEVAENSTPQTETPSLSWSLFDDQTEETTTPEVVETSSLSWSTLEDETEDSTLLSQEEISSSIEGLFEDETEQTIGIRENLKENLTRSTNQSEKTLEKEDLPESAPIDRILQSLFTGGIEKPLPTSQPVQNRTAKASTPPSLKIQSGAAPVSIRVAVEQIDRLTEAIGELLISETQQNLQSEQIQNLAKDAIGQFLRCQQQLNLIRDWSDKNFLLRERKRRQSNKTSEKSQHSEIDAEFDALEMDVYSDIHLLLQGLTENMMLLGEKIETIEGMSQQLRFKQGKRKQLLAGAQEDVIQARMVPLGTVLNRFPRMVQQMVATYHKKAELKLSGTEVLIDKVIAEKLYDPLLHIIRNAYDHGLENGGDRLQIGKPEIGQIAIHAYHQGNRTTIEIRDDGQGLDWERIRQKALDKQLLTPEIAASATEDQLAEVLFEPGFSTAEKVGELSGRGIGLDVVRSQLNTLQGSIVVRSRSGQGTTFLLQLPLSLTTARLFVCQSGGTTYSILSDAISQILLPSPDRIQRQESITGGVQTFLRWEEESKEQLIPIHSPTNLLGYRYPIFAPDKSSSLSPFALKAKNQVNPVLMLQLEGQRICLQVERILVEEELVIKTLGKILALPSYIQGYSVLGDGSLTLVLDPIELLAQAKTSTPAIFTAKPDLAAQESRLAMPAQSVSPKQEQATIQNFKVLAIDDSVVQRQNLVRTLNKAGYQVIQAGNGQEAIAQLERHPKINLAICDIEMPYMNGFEFLSYCRQDPRFAQIPVIMLTTRSGQKHRQLALALGAKEYCTKPYSDRELLESVVKLIEASQTNIITS